MPGVMGKSYSFHAFLPCSILASVKPICAALLILAHHAFAAQFAALSESAERAMHDRLWDVAALRLVEAGAASEAPVDKLPDTQLMLAECLVRGNRPAAALAVLETSAVRDHPEAQFWVGQALAGEGRFAEAVEKLLPIAADPSNPLQAEAAFTAANLQVSLDRHPEALATLALLAGSDDPRKSVDSQLRRTAILLDLGDIAGARGMLPGTDAIPPALLPFANLLQGYLHLVEGKFSEAQVVFSSLLADPKGQGNRRYNLAAIGMADAIAAQGDTAAAMDSLFAFIQSRPETSRLSPMFLRINEWMPEEMLTADHPALLRLAGWMPKTAPSAGGFINVEAGSAAAAWPTATVALTDLEAFATYTRALALRRINTPPARTESELLLQRLRILAPGHFIIPKCLLTLAGWKLGEGKTDEAMALLDTLRRDARSLRIRGEAAFLNAVEAYRKGDEKLAGTLFAEAAGFLDGTDREAAAFNAGLALGDGENFPLTAQNIVPKAVGKKLETDLRLEKALSEASPEKAKTMLDEFLRENPDHPRAAEARLAIAEAALASVPPDLSTAKAQVDTVAASAESLPANMEPRLALARLRLLDLSGKTEETVALAGSITEEFPDSPTSSEASMILGKTLFRAGQYNEARLTLEKLASSEPGTQRSQAALLLAARSAALGATVQSREEALALFDRTMAADGPLKPLALLEKARLLIDLNRLPDAIGFLKAAYAGKTPDDPSRLPTGLLLAEAIYARGESDPESLSEALEIYNSLLDPTKDNLPSYFRIQYLRGLTLEKLPDAADPEKTRLAEARDAYFSVLDRPADPPPPEWEWFGRSGFRLLTLLENVEDWKAAIAIAEKIASFGGPRAEEAATRARQLRLKHMIWED